jgi:hypothetical protein
MLAVLGALSSFGPLSMDMYLPSTPTIAANLHASQSLVQLTLSGCLAGLAGHPPLAALLVPLFFFLSWAAPRAADTGAKGNS